MFDREAQPPGGPPLRRDPLPGSPVDRLRPRSAPQLLDAGFEVLRFRPGAIATLLVVLYGPFLVAALWMMDRAGNGWFPVLSLASLRRLLDDATSGGSEELWWAAGATGATLVGEMLFAFALATLVRHWLDGDDIGVRSVLRTTARRLPGLAAAWIAALVLKLLGAALCLVGLVVFVPRLSLLAPVMAFEHRSPTKALGRSGELVARTSDRALFLVAIAPVLSFALPWALQAGADQGFHAVEQFSTVMGIAASLILLVARSATMTLFYVDIRVRTEGLDLALRAPAALERADVATRAPVSGPLP